MNVKFRKKLVAAILFTLIFYANSHQQIWAYDERLQEMDSIAMETKDQESENISTHQDINAPSIMLHIGESAFDPLRSDSTLSVKSIERYEEGEQGYYIVQFDGPIQPDWKTALQGVGVEIFDYVPDFSFIVRMSAENEQMVRGLPHVRWLGIYQPSFRVSKSVMGKFYSQGKASGNAMVDLRINLFPNIDVESVEARITALGGIVEERHDTDLKTTLKVTVPASGIQELPAIEGIKWIEQTPTWKMFNDVSTDIMNVRFPRNTYGLYGWGQTVGVADTGLDQGDIIPANLHDDFEDGNGTSRVLEIIDRVEADETGVDGSDVNGHGTHVAGSVLGNGILSGSDPANEIFPFDAHTGIAPEANFVFQALQDNDTGEWTGIPADLTELFAEAETAGAELHTNSWGGRTASMYTASSQDVDEYMWSHPNFLILFAAGNEGVDLDADGVIDLYSIGSPATAKNCLTVGASEGDQPAEAGYDYSWGEIGGPVFPVDPISSDHISDNDRGIAAFSSRGPALDGRYKPDIVAPGTNILSTRTQALDASVDVGWGNFNENYAWAGGTSMATPLAAGASALMREYLMAEKGFDNPSAALIKAALLNSAEDISPGQYTTDTAQEIPDSPVPNNIEGWGRLNLGDGLYPSAPFDILFHDETTGLETGASIDFPITLTDDSSPLRINLTWTDYPGLPSAHGGLVNDLDLQLIGPSNDVYYPDQALQKTTISTVSYYSDGASRYNFNNFAVRFTPERYPAYLDSTTFICRNYPAYYSETDVDVVVYGDNAGLPDTDNELLRKTLTFIPTNFRYITIPLNLTIDSGDVHIALERATDNNFAMSVADDGNPTGRTSWSSTSGVSSWSTADYSAVIRANFRYSPDIATTFDRVNNAVGVTIDTPTTGTYIVRVSGYNVPQGPQPFALVASGNIDSASGVIQFDKDTYSLDENSGEATIAVTRTGGSDGAVNVNFSTVDGTACEGSDYVAVSGTLDWADGDSSEKTISVTIVDDTTQESSETFNLSLSNATGASLGTTANTTVTITGNDDKASDSDSGGGCFLSTIIE